MNITLRALNNLRCFLPSWLLLASAMSAPAALVSVKAAPYLAKGDGVTDDKAAIQNAINSGNDIYFPNGTYLISGSLSLNTATTQKVYAQTTQAATLKRTG